MLKPDAYLLLSNHQTIAGLDSNKLKPPKKLTPYHWYHTESTSWIKFNRGSITYEMGLYWSDTQEIDKKRAFLHRLKINDMARNHANSFKRYEKIASRIAQVRLAIDSMGDMRRFISDGFENMPDGVIVTDSLGIVLFINSHIEQWLRLPKQSVEGQPILNVLKLAHSEALSASPHDQRQREPDWEAIIQKVLINGDSSIAESVLGERDLMFHFVPSFASTPGDAGMIINLSDVTSIKQQQRERNELVSFLSHDVRSPLVSQLAMLDGIKSGRITPDNETFDKIAHHAHRSLHLAEQFLQINRAEQVNDTQFYECDLLTIIENSVDSIAQQATKKNIEVTIDAEDELWTNGNAELIERVIINLLSNSVKYSDSDTSITVSLIESDNTAIVSIQDHGYGIAKDELPYIFDRFRRQKSSENSGAKGAGLGLNFVSVVIEKHHGSIEVESQLGKGSTFTIKLPIDKG